jgi:hypothetical protein
MALEFCEAGAKADGMTAAEISTNSELIARIRKYAARYRPLRDFSGIVVHGGTHTGGLEILPARVLGISMGLPEGSGGDNASVRTTPQCNKRHKRRSAIGVAGNGAFPQARLELAGSGPTEPALRTLASELGIADAVVLLGQVSDVYGVMTRWDLFAFTATEREGLGNAVVEAMMLGLPCTVTDVASMREACGGSGALLVPPGNPVALADALCRWLTIFRHESKSAGGHETGS